MLVTKTNNKHRHHRVFLHKIHKYGTTPPPSDWNKIESCTDQSNQVSLDSNSVDDISISGTSNGDRCGGILHGVCGQDQTDGIKSALCNNHVGYHIRIGYIGMEDLLGKLSCFDIILE